MDVVGTERSEITLKRFLLYSLMFRKQDIEFKRISDFVKGDSEDEEVSEYLKEEFGLTLFNNIRKMKVEVFDNGNS